MKPLREEDYNYTYPIKAKRFSRWEIAVRKMREDEMPDDGCTYYCDVDGSIYTEGEAGFEIVTE